MKYSVITFGCRVNQADSLGFEEELRLNGASAAPPEQADLVVVNTCSVTSSADQGARQAIRRVARANPAARIVVTGCYATRRPDEIRELPNVVRVVPNNDKPRFLTLVAQDLSPAECSPVAQDLSPAECSPVAQDLSPAECSPVAQDLSPAECSPLVAQDFSPAECSPLVAQDFSPAECSPLVAQDFSPAVAAGTVTTAQRFGDGEGSCGAAIQPGVAGRTAFTLRVQTGCAEPCAYCIIPTTRGAPQSVPVDAVLREVERVAAAGFREIALTGVHLGSYGRDLTPASSLLELLRALAERPCSRARAFDPSTSSGSSRARSRDDGLRLDPSSVEGRESALEREVFGPRGWGPAQLGDDGLLFRISSLEPMDCTAEVVALVAGSACFAPHFHLPLQHASSRVLAAMRRPYTIQHYTALVTDIRERIPDAAIGSDIIVGFPGESDEEFEQLASYLEASPLTHIHVFPYSDRPGTAASAMGEKVPGAVIRERARRIREIAGRLTSKFLASQVGSVHRALTLEDGSLVVTGNYLKVRIPPGRARNDWVTVKVTEAGPAMKGVIWTTQ